MAQKGPSNGEGEGGSDGKVIKFGTFLGEREVIFITMMSLRQRLHEI